MKHQQEHPEEATEIRTLQKGNVIYETLQIQNSVVDIGNLVRTEIQFS